METTLPLQEVASYVLLKDISNLLDFIERLKNEEDKIALHMDQIEKLKLKLTIMSTFLQLSYFSLDGFNDRVSSKALQVDDLVQSLFHLSRDDMLVKLKDHIVPRLLETIKSCINSQHHFSKSTDTMTEDQLVEILNELLVNLHDLPKCCAELIFPLMTQYKVIQNVCVNIRDFHGLKVNGCVKHEIVEYVLPQFQLMAERVGHFCFVLLSYHLDVPQVNFKLAHLLMKIIPVELEVMHICSTNLEASKSAEVGRFIKQLQESSPAILREYLIHLQVHMVTVLNASTSARSIHVMIEFLLIILTDMPKDFIYHDKLFDLLARVGALTREVSILVCNLEENSRNEENMNETNCGSLDLLESIELLKEDKAPKDSSQLCFPKSDGPIFMTLLLRNLNDLLKSNAYSSTLIKEEVQMVKEDLEFIRSFFGKVEQKLNRDLWNCALDVAYEAEHSINSILVRDHGLLQLIFLLPKIIEKIKLFKEEVQQKIPKNRGLVVVNSPKKPIEISKSSATSQIIVGFEKETKDIITKLTKGPTEIDVISIVGMPGLGKTTLAYKVYNEKFVVDHFDVRAWCTVDQERNEKKLLQKIYNQVIGMKEKFSEDRIDDGVADKLRKRLFGKRYLIVLDDLWDTATWDEVTRPFPEFQKRSRIILTSRKQEVALHGKCHSDPLYLRLFTQGESWELLEKRVFGEEHCPDELLDVKHFLSLKLYTDESECLWRPDHLPYIRHLRLLKRLELRRISFSDSLLNDIGMLVHLRYLHIHTMAEVLPPSFSYLLNLESLRVFGPDNMDISPCIWSLAKLQQGNISRCSFFEQKVLEEDSKLENLRVLRWVRFTYSEDTEEFFQRFPNLRSLNFIFNEPRKCPAEKIRFPRLDVLNELE